MRVLLQQQLIAHPHYIVNHIIFINENCMHTSFVEIKDAIVQIVLVMQ
jgi:hypothetical protein